MFEFLLVLVVPVQQSRSWAPAVCTACRDNSAGWAALPITGDQNLIIDSNRS